MHPILASKRWSLSALLRGIPVVLLLSLPCMAHAEPLEEDYDALVAAGLKAFDENRLIDARASFERAHALRPSARTYRVLGLTAVALDWYGRAERELRAALADSRQPLSDVQQHEVHAWLGWMQASLGRVSVTMMPEHAQWTLDGAAVEGRETLLEPGEHRVHAAADGFIAREVVFDAVAGQRAEVRVALEPAPLPPTVVQPASIAAPLEVARVPLQNREDGAHWGWVAGVGVGVALTGATLFAFGLREIDKVENAELGVRRQDLEPAKDRAPWMTGIGIGLASAGLASLSVAWIASLLEGDREPIDGLSCTVGASSAVGCSLGGRF